MKIGYQGVAGAYSEMALIQVFGKQDERYGYDEFKALMDDLSIGKLDYALIPIENSTTGIIYRTMDLLRYHDLIADFETTVKINHCLIGLEDARLEDIDEVFSHPEALSQCQNFFKTHPQMTQTGYVDTAKSVEYILKLNDPKKAALASSWAAQLYQVPTLEHDVQDKKENTTRFLAFRKQDGIYALGNKMTLYFEIDHQVGTLASVLDYFKEHHINLLNIQSRPIENKNFKYGFFIDAKVDNDFDLETFSQLVSSYNILGLYKENLEA